MKVLQFYRTYLPETQGGLEEAIRQICIATGRYGAKHRVLTLARVNRVHRIPRPEAEVIQAPLQLEPAACSMGLALFREYQKQAKWADIIHIHHPWPFADLVHLISRVDKPVVLTYHSDIVRQRALEKLYSPLRELFYQKVDKIVSTSLNYVQTSPVLQKLSPPPEVIPLCLSPDTYKPASREALKFVDETFGRDFYLFVGVLRYYKGLHHLVDAAAANGLPVVIAGFDKEEKQLKAQAKKLGATNIKFAGFVSNDIKQALFHRCRAVVFPSCQRCEAFGVTLLEGQFHSKPLVTCEIGTGTSYVNIHGQTGLVIPPDDPNALSEAMRRLEHDDGLVQQLGAAGRQRFEQLFSEKQVGDKYMRLYRRLIDGKARIN